MCLQFFRGERCFVSDESSQEDNIEVTENRTTTENIRYTWTFLGVEVSTDDVHQFLEWLGYLPGVEVVVGGIDAGIYFAEGKHSEALKALLGAILGSKLLKLGGKRLN